MNAISGVQANLDALDPGDPGSTVRARIAVAAAVKVLHAERDMGAMLVQLLDPNAGRLLNASA